MAAASTRLFIAITVLASWWILPGRLLSQTPQPQYIDGVSSVSGGSDVGAEQVFTLTFTDPQGPQAIAWGVVAFYTGTPNKPRLNCPIQFSPGAGLEVWGEGWSVPPNGAPQSSADGSCTLNFAHSTVNWGKAGKPASPITIALAITFHSAATYQVIAQVFDLQNLSSPVVSMGTWTVGLPAPQYIDGVSSVNGGGDVGVEQIFTLTFTDPQGPQAIAWGVVAFYTGTPNNPGLNCPVQFSPGAGLEVWGRGWNVPPNGAAQTSADGSCTLNFAHSSVNWGQAGNPASPITITVALTFHAAAMYQVMSQAFDVSNQSSPIVSMGTWTVGMPSPQYVDGVSRVNGGSDVGMEQVFTFTFTDPQGPQAITWGVAAFYTGNPNSPALNCAIQFSPAAGLEVWGMGWNVPPNGAAQTSADGSCTLNFAHSAVNWGSARNPASPITVTLAITLHRAAKYQVMSQVFDLSNLSSPVVSIGTWIAGSPAISSIDGVNPLAGAGVFGVEHVFDVQITDPYGPGSLNSGEIVFQIPGSAVSCPVVFSRTAGIALQGQNASCTLNLAHSSANWLSGTDPTVPVTVNPAITFLYGSATPYTITGTVSDNAGQTSPATVLGTWTVPAITISVSPAAISLRANQTQQFTAAVAGSNNTAVTWTVSPNVGLISASGLYTAPANIATRQSITVRATSAADNTRTGLATITLNPPVNLWLSPSNLTMFGGQTQQFSALFGNSNTNAVTWSLGNGSPGDLSTSGLYTAPATIGSVSTVTVTATSATDPSQTGMTTITLQPTEISVCPVRTR